MEKRRAELEYYREHLVNSEGSVLLGTEKQGTESSLENCVCVLD
jgi:hypothetical protein